MLYLPLLWFGGKFSPAAGPGSSCKPAGLSFSIDICSQATSKWKIFLQTIKLQKKTMQPFNSFICRQCFEYFITAIQKVQDTNHPEQYVCVSLWSLFKYLFPVIFFPFIKHVNYYKRRIRGLLSGIFSESTY